MEFDKVRFDFQNKDRGVRTDSQEFPCGKEKIDTAAGLARPENQASIALVEFERGIDPAHLEVLMKNADILIQAKDTRLAMNILRNILIKSPAHPEALMRLGLCLREEGRYEEALKCFRALSRTPKKVEGQILAAEVYYLSERDEMALAAYRELLRGPVIESATVLFDIYKNIGNIHVRAGDFEAAEEFYNKAYTIDPHSDVLMVNFGTLEIQRQNMTEAVQRFRQAVEINSENDKAWVGLAIVHRQMGDLELAWANLHRALDTNRLNRTAIRLAVEWGVVDSRLSVAIARLQEYLESHGEDAEMSFTLAKIFTHMGRLIDARIELERVLALDPAIQGADSLRQCLDAEIAKNQISVNKKMENGL